MSTRLPIVHIEQLVEGTTSHTRRDGHLSVADLRDLLDRLADADATTPSVASLAAGFVPLASLDHPFLLTTSDLRLGALASWTHLLGRAGLSSIAFCASETLHRDDTLSARDLPLLTGAGVALASRGTTERPLVGLPLAELRDELEESHRRLSEAAGYPVRLLAPPTTADGRALDGLVLREARRAGYRTFLKPGRAPRVAGPDPDDPLTYRPVLRGDTPDRLVDWITGDLVARGSTELERLTSAPRRLLDRLSELSGIGRHE